MYDDEPPDWECNKTIMPGGKSIASLPTPHTRYYPHPGKLRRVVVTVTKYYGIGQHYHVSIDESFNHVWGGDAWYGFHDDTEGKGSYQSRPFALMASAKVWIRQQIKQFSRKTHDVTYSGDRRPKWFYPEGD